MSRPLRIEYPGAYYHVMNRGWAFQPIYETPQDRQVFLKTLEEAHTRWDFRVLCYCLMGNHYHLCIQTLRVPLSRIMRHIDGVYTQRYNRRTRRDGPLFRGRYRAILIEKERYLLAVARYIHHNPMEAGLVKRPEAYQWSSLKDYLSRGKKPEWLDTRDLLDPFGGRKGPFLVFMHGKLEEEIKAFYQKERSGPILGTEEFVEEVRVGRSGGGVSREIPEERHLAIPLEVCLKAVAEDYRVALSGLVSSRRGLDNEPRRVAMYVGWEFGGYRHKELAERFGVGSYTAVSSACAQVRAGKDRDRALRRRIERIRHRLNAHYRQKAT